MAKTVKRYRGNKSPSALYPKIINEFPAHKVYWELFAGSAQILQKKKPAKLNIVIEKDHQLTDYPAGTVVVHDCAISLLNELQYLGKDHLIYLDPPYIIKERRDQRRYYDHELTDADHVALIIALLLCRCNIAISHYPCELYDGLLKFGWRRKDIKVSYHGVPQIESLYMNFPAEGRLHETTFVGLNKTDRQRIKRKARNLRRFLLEMPPNERQALLDEIVDLR